MSNLRKGKKKTKRAKPGDILERLRRMVSDDSEEDDDFLETRPAAASSTSERQPNTANVGISSPEEEAAKVLKSIFRCSICFQTPMCLPAAACANCHAVIGCIPCAEQWSASSANGSQCPLCRTSVNYVVIPVLREICSLLGTPIRNNGEEVEAGSDTDTIPYGVGDGEEVDLRPVL